MNAKNVIKSTPLLSLPENNASPFFKRWLVLGFVATNLGLMAGNVLAGPLPEGVKKPGGADIAHIEKVMCRHNNVLYPLDKRLVINSKEYICTRYNGWVLSPV